MGALAIYKRIITIAGCANIVSGFRNIVLSFLSSPPSIIYAITLLAPYTLANEKGMQAAIEDILMTTPVFLHKKKYMQNKHI